MQLHPAELEVFLETVELEGVREFEGADIAALRADLPLEIGHAPTQIVQGEART